LIRTALFQRPQRLRCIVDLARIDNAVVVRVERPDDRRERRTGGPISSLAALPVSLVWPGRAVIIGSLAERRAGAQRRANGEHCDSLPFGTIELLFHDDVWRTIRPLLPKNLAPLC
jgi:hypothetical protein